MSILSLSFLLFTVALLIVYYVLPGKAQWIALLCGSAFFILCAGWKDLLHIGLVTLVTWAAGRYFSGQYGEKEAGDHSSGKKRRAVLILVLVLLFGSMTLIKYGEPVLSWLGSVSGGAVSLPLSQITIPLGLSYYTFQAAGWLIDAYRGKADGKISPLKLFLFIGFFPQLPQGPISSWKELGESLLSGHRLEPENLVSGFTLMLWGYFKKMVIADRLSPTTEYLREASEPLPGWMILGGTILFAVRLYADFSGGMDVVTGIARLFGVTLPENFRRPFFSKSVGEYWRRWHISLGKWFRTYLMYPLTTSRGGIALGRAASRVFGKKTGRKIPTALATFLIFLLIGIWHTFSWNALIYGAYFGILLAVILLMEPVLKKWARKMSFADSPGAGALRMIRTWLLILPAQFFAFTDSPRQAVSLLRGVFHGWTFAGAGEQLTQVLEAREWVIALIGLCVLLTVDIIGERTDRDLSVRISRGNLAVRWLILIGLILAILIFGMYGATYDSSAFMYAQF